MPKVIYILFGALFTLSVSYTLGRLLFERLRIRLYREEERLFSFLTGAAMLHAIVFALLAAQIALKGVFLATGILIIGYGWMRGAFRRTDSPALPPLEKAWRWIFRLVYTAYIVLYVSNAMAPEMSADGSSYHLGLVAHYLRDHGFSRITTDMYASLSQGIEMLYTFAFSFGRHSAASSVHVAFTLLLPHLMMAHARRFGFPAAGVGGALFFLCSPVVGADGTTAYNDVAVTAIVFGVYSLLRIWFSERQNAILIPLGLLSGFCFASKYTAALAIPFAALPILIQLIRSRRPWLRPLLIFSCCVAIMVLPWMAKNAIVVDNPLSPFLNKIFRNEFIHVSFEEEYIQQMRHYGNPKSYWDLPLDLTVHGAMLAGMLGPIFVLTPLALLTLRLPEGRWLLLAALVFGLPYLNNIGTRFLLPALPFFSLALALAVARARFILPALVLIHAIISWPPVLKRYCSPYAWRLERIPIAAALRITNEEKYLTEHHYGYVVARMIEDHVPAGEKVFTFGTIAEAYTSRQILTAYKAAENNVLSDILWAGLFPGEAPIRRALYSFKEAKLRRLKLVPSEPVPGHWTVTEFRVLENEKILPRLPEWRVRSWPKPSDAVLAFDNSPVTRYKTWENVRPGMFLELDMAEERMITAVLLETTQDQGHIPLQLYGQKETGDWMLLSAKPEQTEIPLPKGLRRAAMQEFRDRGVRYILAFTDDPGAQEYLANPALWGLRIIADRGGARLYYIEGSPDE